LRVAGLGADGAGNVYFSDFINNRTWKIPTTAAQLSTDRPAVVMTGFKDGPPVTASSLLIKSDIPGVPIAIQVIGNASWLRASATGSGAKFVNGAMRLRIRDISDQAANTAFQSSGIVAERCPSLPVLN
jgi:hypothetical protein